MLSLSPGRPLQNVLCLGAHCDDIEIGCGATLLGLAAGEPPPRFHWVVFSSDPTREAETRRAAARLLGDAETRVEVHRFRNGFFPYVGADIKQAFEALKQRVQPDLIFTHYRQDRHQDHRLISDLTWNTFRDHLIFEYEIPKYDGDLGHPNVFVPASQAAAEHKVAVLMEEFPSQRDHAWFCPQTFTALLRLRGVECNAPDGLAEAFLARKLVLGGA